MKSSLTEEIDGYTYEIGMFGASQGVGIVAKMGAIVGPGMAKATTDGDVAGLGTSAIAEMLANLNSRTVQDLVKELMGVVHVMGEDGGPLDKIFDRHFAGRYGALLKVCKSVVAHNGFFDLLGAFGDEKA